MALEKLFGRGVRRGDVVLEIAALHPPLTAAPHFQGAKLAGSHQGVHLGRRRIEDLSDIGEGEKTWSHLCIMALASR